MRGCRTDTATLPCAGAGMSRAATFGSLGQRARLRPILHGPELLLGKTAFLLTEATAHGLDRDVAGRTGPWIAGGEHDPGAGGLDVTVEGLGELEAADRSI